MSTSGPAVFISYRRGDTDFAAVQLYQQLASEFGSRNVFFDVDSLSMGTNFPERIRGHIAQSNAMLVLIGERWNLDRLHVETDWVRREIEEAIDLNVAVIPVAVGKAELPEKDVLPQSLAELLEANGARLRVPPDWQGDLLRLIRGVRSIAADRGPRLEPLDVPKPPKQEVRPEIDVGFKPLDVAWSRDGWRVAVAGNMGNLQLFDVSSGQALASCSGHRGWVRSIDWSPDGSELASAGNDGTVRFWSAVDLAARRVHDGHEGWVLCASWAPDGMRLASGGNDNAVHIVNSLSGSRLHDLAGHDDWVRSVAWSPDGARLASGSHSGEIVIWDGGDGQPLFARNAHDDRVRSIAWSPDGGRLLSGGADGKVQVWDASGLELIESMSLDDVEVNALSCLSGSNHVAVVGSRGLTQVRDMTTGSIIHDFVGHAGSVFGLDWSPSGSHLATSGEDQTVRLWLAADDV